MIPKGFPKLPDFPPGEVWLAGAGPGDPRLLTVLALHAIGQADDVVYDALVDRRVLDLCRDGAELIAAGKRGGRPSPHQRDINEVLIERSRRGRRVLRLKGGDPFVFGRGGEELDHLRRHDVPVIIVPGITAALGCAAEAALPLTLRNEATRVALVTAHRADDAAGGRSGEGAARIDRGEVGPLLFLAPGHAAGFRKCRVDAFLRASVGTIAATGRKMD